MSARNNIFVALGFCLIFSFLSTEARTLEETSVKTKRDIDDWWSLLEDLIYDNDSGSDEDGDDENILICRNCTVVVQAAPNATTDGGSTVPPTAPGSTAGTPVSPPGSTAGTPATVTPVPPATSAPDQPTSSTVTTPAPAVTPAPAPGG